MDKITQYNFSFDQLVRSFVEKYYKNDEDDIAEYYIIGEWWNLWPDIVEVNDMYRRITDIHTALKNDIPENKLFARYDYSLNKHTINKKWGDEVIVNLYNFAFWPTEYTEEQRETDEAKVKEIYQSLMEECDKSKNEDQKVREDKRKKDCINVWNEHIWDVFVSVYDAKKALQEYDILGNT